MAAAVLAYGLRGRSRFRAAAAPDVKGYTPEPLATATVRLPRPQAGDAQRFVRGLDLPGQWWTLFHSKALNSLVDKALAANPDLQAAQAALVVARRTFMPRSARCFPPSTPISPAAGK